MEKRIKIRIGALAVLGILLSMVCIPAIYMAQTWGSDHTSDTSYRVIIDDDDNANDEVFAVWHDGDENDNPPGEELFRIQENGRVGIGSITPTAKLHIIQTDAADCFRVDDRSGDPTPFVIDQNGRVGIVTPTPQTMLHVMTSGADNHIRVQRQGYNRYMDLISGGAFCALNCVNTYDEVFQIQEDGVARFHITKGGNTGIGTTSPTERLDVAGTVRMTGFRMPTGASSGYVLTSNANGVGTWQEPQIGIGGSGTTNYIPKFTGATTLGDSVIYETGGNIGIGTILPFATLDVNGGLATNTITVGVTVPGPVYNVPAPNTDFTILVDTTRVGAAVTINLPPAAAVDGQILVVKKIDSMPLGFPVFIIPSPGETIDGAPGGVVINVNYNSYMIQADTTNGIPQWFII